MNDQPNHREKRWRDRLFLVLGVGLGGLLFIYFVLPGFVLGLLFKTKMLDPNTQNEQIRTISARVFCVPFYMSHKVGLLGDFYEWQCYVVSGYR
ncbi:MAG TPA: hypothetical protein VHX44_14230 [Planctomycetota bacterium]|jgi:hypothetical protein|nr:hypothetical protein [Planctomycetota bacterium]